MQTHDAPLLLFVFDNQDGSFAHGVVFSIVA